MDSSESQIIVGIYVRGGSRLQGNRSSSRVQIADAGYGSSTARSNDSLAAGVVATGEIDHLVSRIRLGHRREYSITHISRIQVGDDGVPFRGYPHSADTISRCQGPCRVIRTRAVVHRRGVVVVVRSRVNATHDHHGVIRTRLVVHRCVRVVVVRSRVRATHDHLWLRFIIISPKAADERCRQHAQSKHHCNYFHIFHSVSRSSGARDDVYRL